MVKQRSNNKKLIYGVVIYHFISKHFPAAIIDQNIHFKTLRELAFKNPENQALLENFIYAQMPEAFTDAYNSFGYKVNVLKLPELYSRENWNYIKCHEVNIFGNIPNVYLKKIHEIFKNGVTYWHNL